MSYDILVTGMDPSRVPTAAELTTRAKALGFDIEFTSDSKIGAASGYFPVLNGGSESGFEVTVLRGDDETIFELMFSCHELHEARTAFIVGGILADLAGGSVRDPQEGEDYMPTDALEHARNLEW